MNDFSLLEDVLASFSFDLSQKQKEQFQLFFEAMVEKNKVMNLTTITDWNDVLVKHFIDSVMVMRQVNLEKTRALIDLGTGAGFPGIPLKILFPEVSMTLVDSLQKRIHFLEEVKETLGFKDLILVHGRAEELGQREDLREQFDVCVSRAVSQLVVLSEFCLPFVKVGGFFVSYKSADCEAEVNAAKNAMKILGGKLRKIDQFILPNSDFGRSLVVVEKVASTRNKYPRKPGVPTKSPLF